MHDLPAAADSSIDPRLDRIAMGEVMLVEQGSAFGGAELLGKLGKEPRVSDGAIEVDQEPREGARIERRS